MIWKKESLCNAAAYFLYSLVALLGEVVKQHKKSCLCMLISQLDKTIPAIQEIRETERASIEWEAVGSFFNKIQRDWDWFETSTWTQTRWLDKQNEMEKARQSKTRER